MTTDLDRERLRRFRAADGEPDPAARDAARVALLERIDAAAAPAPARAVRRPRRRWLAGAFGLAGAAAAAAALVVGLGSGGVHPQDATAAQLLRHVAVVAAQ